jgi:hypothetical protein
MPEQTGSSRRYWFRLNFETVAALAALVTSVAAVYIAWQETRIMREQQHASVIPIVSSGVGISNSAGDRPELRFHLENAGVGPALIQNVTMRLGGEPLNSWSALEAAVLPEALHGASDFEVNRLENHVLQAGRTVSVLVVQWPPTEETEQAISGFFEDVVSGSRKVPVLEACYCSVFERCWRTVPDSQPRQVDACPVSTDFITNMFREGVRR